jgi:hypothetical protein
MSSISSSGSRLKSIGCRTHHCYWSLVSCFSDEAAASEASQATTDPITESWVAQLTPKHPSYGQEGAVRKKIAPTSTTRIISFSLFTPIPPTVHYHCTLSNLLSRYVTIALPSPQLLPSPTDDTPPWLALACSLRDDERVTGSGHAIHRCYIWHWRFPPASGPADPRQSGTRLLVWPLLRILMVSQLGLGFLGTPVGVNKA